MKKAENSVRYEYREELNRRVFSFVEDHEGTVNKWIRPLRPYVMVFVLPKEFKNVRIIIPDVAKTNKPTYEGIVIRTYEPYWRTKLISKPNRVPEAQALVGNEEYIEYWRMDPMVNVGDHVLFPHHVGIPVPFMDYDMHKFRLIKEDDLVGGLEYDNELEKDLVKTLVLAGEGGTFETIAKALMDGFVIARRDERSRTLSGIGEFSGS